MAFENDFWYLLNILGKRLCSRGFHAMGAHSDPVKARFGTPSGMLRENLGYMFFEKIRTLPQNCQHCHFCRFVLDS